MAVDLTRAINPQRQYVNPAVARGSNQSTRSWGALSASTDVNAHPDVYADNNAFGVHLGVTGAGGSGEREVGAAYAIELPNSNPARVIPYRATAPVSAELTSCILQAGFVGDAVATLDPDTPEVIGSLGAFSLLTQIYVSPPSAGGSPRVLEFQNGEFRLGENLGRCDICLTIHSTWIIDSAADVPFRFFAQVDSAGTGTWGAAIEMSEDSHRSIDTPDSRVYTTGWLTTSDGVLKGAFIRASVERLGGPAGPVLLTMRNPKLILEVRFRAP